jgi:hypothetical protein
MDKLRVYINITVEEKTHLVNVLSFFSEGKVKNPQAL